ncbi:hypothetical protein PHLCEN_2v10561 [Hermanssonia centrifuga]|uniref:Uncharacterized protein n=1 Tax=Hermanssonia centrifuga TaxID=98765 RepID=A0A2R6NMX9_9APHY|nr:hypothetical protein PHLCEN_2v10561 [Hermanssonia centrifuga]
MEQVLSRIYLAGLGSCSHRPTGGGSRAGHVEHIQEHEIRHPRYTKPRFPEYYASSI